MADLPKELVEEVEASLIAYRAHTYRTSPSLRLQSLEQAVEFVRERGFILFWPIKNLDLPSLWVAVAGDRPVAAEHDDPGHVTWRWKDEMLSKRRWYYGKLLRGKATLVSLDLLPAFYALSPRLADTDDFREAYHEGGLTREALQVAEAILREGPLDTIALRRAAGLSRPQAKYRFDRALAELQRGLWILPVGVAKAGAWRYAFVYELFDRWYPDIPTQAGVLSEEEARAQIMDDLLRSVGIASPMAIATALRWKREAVNRAILNLVGSRRALHLPDGGAVHHNLLQFLELAS